MEHEDYGRVLRDLGLEVAVLDADPRFPDCCFVEDTAIVVEDLAIITCLGAPPRRGEEIAVETALSRFKKTRKVKPPATVEGGDVLRIENKIFIGQTERTNAVGVEQVREILGENYDVVPVRVEGVLHLKSAYNYVGGDVLMKKKGRVAPALPTNFEVLKVPPAEARKASFLAVRGKIVLPGDCPESRRLLERRGFDVIQVGFRRYAKPREVLRVCRFYSQDDYANMFISRLCNTGTVVLGQGG